MCGDTFTCVPHSGLHEQEWLHFIQGAGGKVIGIRIGLAPTGLDVFLVVLGFTLTADRVETTVIRRKRLLGIAQISKRTHSSVRAVPGSFCELHKEALTGALSEAYDVSSAEAAGADGSGSSV